LIPHLLVVLSFLAAGFALLFRPLAAQTPRDGEPATATYGNKEEMADEEIPLREAAMWTYEEVKDTRGGVIVRDLNETSEKILSYYCYALSERIPIYGQFSLSHREGRVDLDSPHTRRIVFDGSITNAKPLYAGEEGASNLFVLKSDLVRAIEGIKQQM